MTYVFASVVRRSGSWADESVLNASSRQRIGAASRCHSNCRGAGGASSSPDCSLAHPSCGDTQSGDMLFADSNFATKSRQVVCWSELFGIYSPAPYRSKRYLACRRFLNPINRQLSGGTN